MKFFYQIKLSDGYGSFDRTTVLQNIIEADSKQDVLKHLEETYPEYFEGNKVAQKLTKKSEQIVYVTIFELNDYWESYWTSEVECVVCGKKVPLIEIKNYLGYIELSKFACCPECSAQVAQTLEKRREEGNDEYWSNLCDYYYIYRIAHKTNGKCYVGYTAREPIFRWWEHLKHSDLPIGQALQSEGIEAFTFEVLEKHHKQDKTVQDMHDIETSYILKYDSIDNGYNCVVSKVQEVEPVKQKTLFDIDGGSTNGES